MGSNYVNDFVKFGRTYEVLVSGNSASRADVADVLNLSVRNASGDMVPFGSFATVEETLGQPSVSRYSMYTTASVTGNVALPPHSHDRSRVRLRSNAHALRNGCRSCEQNLAGHSRCLRHGRECRSWNIVCPQFLGAPPDIPGKIPLQGVRRQNSGAKNFRNSSIANA